MALLALKKGNNFIYGDYLKWAVDEKWKIIDGYFYNLSQAPSGWYVQVS